MHRIALVTQVPVFPQNAGNRSRIRSMIEFLQSQGHQVILIKIPSEEKGGDEADVAAHNGLLGPGNYVDLDRLTTPLRLGRKLRQFGSRRVVELLGNLNSGHDARFRRPVDFRTPIGLARAVQRVVLERGCTCCLVEYVFNSAVLKGMPPHVLRLIDTHDVFTNRHHGFAAQGKPQDYWVSLSPRQERKGLLRADGVIAIQGDDARYFNDLLHGQRQAPQVVVSSHLIPVIAAPAETAASHRAAFVGSTNAANAQGVRRFLDKTLPHVLRLDPAFRLVLAGQICSVIPDHPRVDKFGPFDDIGQVFQRAPVSINPVVTGTGIAIKVLESLAYGIPVVATVAGARGLADLNEKGLSIAGNEDDAAFAQALARLTQSPALRHAQGQAAFAAMQDWNRAQTDALTRLLALPKPTRASRGLTR